MKTNEPFISPRTEEATQTSVTSPVTLQETIDSLESPVTSQQRLISKSGRCNVNLTNVTSKKCRYLTDIFTTLIDMRWRYSLIFFVSALISTWVMFGLIWWLIAVVRLNSVDLTNTKSEPCMDNVHDFVSAFLFSVETQQAIGYGSRAIGPSCPHAILLFLVQSLVGLCVECIITGLVYVKLSRPKARAHTIVFSKRAVICVREGGYCLLFRIGDMRRSHFVQTNIRAILVKSQVTAENETMSMRQFPLHLETEETEKRDFVFLAWPVTIIHRITRLSPLWETTQDELNGQPVELVVILEGIVEVSGKNLQVRTSYINTEILWGAQLTPLSTCTTTEGKTAIDFDEFHSTLPVPMPSESARLYAMQRQSKETKENSDLTGEGEDLFISEPLTFAPISHSRSNKRGRYKFANSWKKWRRF